MANKNDDKGHALLNRFSSMKKDLYIDKEKRPINAKHCKNIQDCNKWRSQVIKEISNKITQIQNAMLGEEKIRHLNDQINNLIREKDSWEERILELGGQDWRTVDGSNYKKGEYLYFGRAKDLPGVRDLFELDRPSAPKRTKEEFYKNITYKYYGSEFETKEQLELETELEQELRIKSTSQFKNKSTYNINIDKFRSIHVCSEYTNNEISSIINTMSNKEKQLELEKILIQRKKEELINKIKSD